MSRLAGIVVLLALMSLSILGCDTRESVNCHPNPFGAGTTCEKTSENTSEFANWLQDNWLWVALGGIGVAYLIQEEVRKQLAKRQGGSGSVSAPQLASVLASATRPGDVLRADDGSSLQIESVSLRADGSTWLTFTNGRTQVCPKDMNVQRMS